MKPMCVMFVCLKGRLHEHHRNESDFDDLDTLLEDLWTQTWVIKSKLESFIIWVTALSIEMQSIKT